MKSFIIIFLLFVGCGANDYIRPEWMNAPTIYKCTKIQMENVQQETKWCNENTGYLSSYCYGAAIIRNCTK